MAGSIWRLSYPVSRPFSARATLALLSYTGLAFVALALFQFFTSAKTLQCLSEASSSYADNCAPASLQLFGQYCARALADPI